MANDNDTNYDLDPGVPDQGFHVDPGGLPKLPFPALPIPLPIPTIPIPDIGSFLNFKPPKLLGDFAKDAELEKLTKVANQAGLEVDLDLDMDAGAIKKLITDAAKEKGAALAGSIAGELASALDLDFLSNLGLPKLPLPALPIPIPIPMIPIPDIGSFLNFKPPKLLDDFAKDAELEKLAKVANQAGLEVDLDLDMDAGAIKKLITDAAKDKGAALAGSIAGELASALDLDFLSNLGLPKLPLPALPIPIPIPMIPIPDIGSFLSFAEHPAAKVAEWLE